MLNFAKVRLGGARRKGGKHCTSRETLGCSDASSQVKRLDKLRGAKKFLIPILGMVASRLGSLLTNINGLFCVL